MAKNLTPEEQRKLARIAQEPYQWVRNQAPELMNEWDDEFFDLVDEIKGLWQQARTSRISLAFVLRWEISNVNSSIGIVQDISFLQKKQNQANSTLLFEIDLTGKVVDEIDFNNEIDPAGIAEFSRIRNILIFWLGTELEVFFNGLKWFPKNKLEILKDIKSKKRERLLSMNDHREVLRLHFDRYLRDESRETYWFQKNRLLMPAPEKIFQKSLYGFLMDQVDCIADREPMFKDGSRCDVRVFLDNLDMYFIEIKWVGYSVVRSKEDVIVPNKQHEFGRARAIDGAYQTKLYIDKNNEPDFDHKVKLGIYLLYDAYPKSIIPIDYGDEIRDCPLLDIVEFSLISHSPSVETKGTAKRKGLA